LLTYGKLESSTWATVSGIMNKWRKKKIWDGRNEEVVIAGFKN